MDETNGPSTESTQARTPSKHSRKLRNFLIRPNQQVLYVLVLLGFGWGALVAYIVFFFVFLKGVVNQLGSTYNLDSEVVYSLVSSLNWAIGGAFLLGLILLICFVVAGILVSHRLFGPQVPMQRLIEDLIEGRFSSRGTLRKNDEFQDLMAALNRLASNLEEREKNKTDKSA